MTVAPKKRGIKAKNYSEYEKDTEDKILKIQKQLKRAKSDGLNVKERKQLRNVAQAQHQRLKRKQELITLNSILSDHNSKFTHFVEKILFKDLKGEPELMASILRET